INHGARREAAERAAEDGPCPGPDGYSDLDGQEQGQDPLFSRVVLAVPVGLDGGPQTGRVPGSTLKHLEYLGRVKDISLGMVLYEPAPVARVEGSNDPNFHALLS